MATGGRKHALQCPTSFGSGAERIDLSAIDIPSVAGQVSLPDLLLPCQCDAYIFSTSELVLEEVERDDLPA